MSRLRDAFTLSVAEQRVIIVLLAVLVIATAIKIRRDAAADARPHVAPAIQPSPSPGIRP